MDHPRDRPFICGRLLTMQLQLIVRGDLFLTQSFEPFDFGFSVDEATASSFEFDLELVAGRPSRGLIVGKLSVVACFVSEPIDGNLGHATCGCNESPRCLDAYLIPLLLHDRDLLHDSVNRLICFGQFATELVSLPTVEGQ